MKPNPTALFIDDDKANRRLLRELLQPQHYRLLETENGQQGLAAAQVCQPDVIILELALPDMGGLAVLEQLRQSGQTPVLVLSVRREEADLVAALDGGANDYMVKPFSKAELLARLRVLRRCLPTELEEPVLVKEDLTVDLTQHRVTLGDSVIHLTPTEEALIHGLASYEGKIVTDKYLLRSVWGAGGVDQLHGLRVYISYLRKKLEVTQGRLAIETTGSLGYRLQLRSGGRTRLEVSVPREVLEPSDGVPESIQWANGRV